MIVELHGVFGRDLSCILGVPMLTTLDWLRGRVGSAAPRRVIWLCWALLLHPDQCETVFDLVTWGRFRVVKTRKKDHKSEPQDGSDWSI